MSESVRPGAGEQPGQVIVRVSWASNVLLVLGTVGDVAGVDEMHGLATATCLALFFVSLPVWIYALVKAIARSAVGDDIAVASLFFLQGSAPSRVRWHLLGSTAISIGAAALIATANPTAVLVPMLTLGYVGLWGARYGEFGPRQTRPRHVR